MPTMSARRSAAMSAAAALIRTSSPRRSPPPRRAGADHGDDSNHCAPRHFPSGIASVGLGEIERQVPADEPPPLPPNSELAVIGKPVPRQDGRAKVTGAVRFTVDIALPGMLHARILRSPLPHARVRAIDIAAAARHPGVRAVLLIADPMIRRAPTLRYVGAPVAAVAAVSMAAAEDGAAPDPRRL